MDKWSRRMKRFFALAREEAPLLRNGLVGGIVAFLATSVVGHFFGLSSMVASMLFGALLATVVVREEGGRHPEALALGAAGGMLYALFEGRSPMLGHLLFGSLLALPLTRPPAVPRGATMLWGGLFTLAVGLGWGSIVDRFAGTPAPLQVAGAATFGLAVAAARLPRFLARALHDRADVAFDFWRVSRKLQGEPLRWARVAIRAHRGLLAGADAYRSIPHFFEITERVEWVVGEIFALSLEAQRLADLEGGRPMEPIPSPRRPDEDAHLACEATLERSSTLETRRAEIVAAVRERLDAITAAEATLMRYAAAVGEAGSPSPATTELRRIEAELETERLALQELHPLASH
ncbi:MAG: hypothetical protein D6795_06970 [Deltaproteobacteria bacterium]|nr:MAG: hypothetical protein D6795_06970 [Deltaproteobacteria bacterium]